jgi:hypothetical protein
MKSPRQWGGRGQPCIQGEAMAMVRCDMIGAKLPRWITTKFLVA